MADPQFINKAVEIVKQAVTHDNNEEYEQALSLYKKALEYFMTGLKYEKNEKTKEAIREKVNEYMKRAEALREHLEQKNSKKKKVVKSGVPDKKKSGGSKKSDDDDSDDEKDPEAAKLKAALSSAIVTETPNVKWSDVAGLESAKALLKEAVILPIKFPQLFTGKRTPWKGILLYGPPGTGKSFLAKAVATEAGASTFLSVSSSDLVSKFQGESERLVKNLFELARAKAPAIIFIDEVDSLCGARGDNDNESARRIKTEFLVQMQGVGKGNEGILVLGATNTPWDLDSAIRRRFEKRVYIPLPDLHARATMIKLHIGNTPHSLSDRDFEALAARTEGFSGADLSVLVRDALYEPVRTCQTATHFKKIFPDPSRPTFFQYVPCSPGSSGAQEMSIFDIESEQLKPPDVTMEDFERVLLTAKPSVGPEDLRRQEEWTKQYGQEG
jgi:vacuolar protein-sorting-associated protein 4